MDLRMCILNGIRATVLFAAAGLLPAAVVAEEASQFDLDGVLYQVPLEEGMCAADEAVLRETGLTSLTKGRLSEWLASKAIQLDCRLLTEFREGRLSNSGRMRILFAVRVNGTSTELTSQRLFQFQAMHAALSGEQGAANRDAVLQQILQIAQQRESRDLTCSSVETGAVSIGGKVCLETHRNNQTNQIDVGVALQPIGNRLILAMLLSVNTATQDWPAFADAQQMLDTTRPVARQ